MTYLDKFMLIILWMAAWMMLGGYCIYRLCREIKK